jgi:hypothetical protein
MPLGKENSMLQPPEVMVQVIVNELVEQGLVPPERRGEACRHLSREMRRMTRGFACELLRACEDGVAAASIAAKTLNMEHESFS